MQANDLTFYVNDLDDAIDWYTREFGVEPTEIDHDCACFNLGSLHLNLILATPTTLNESGSNSAVSDTSPYFRCRHHELFEFC